MLINIIIVGIGGFLGAVSRFFISAAVQNLFSKSLFPFGTLAVNLLGCFIMGFLCAVAFNWGGMLSPRAKLLIMTGFLGALTTFSTFGNETFDLIRDNEIILALLNVGIQVIFGLIAVWLGYVIAYFIKTIQ
ncbi:MAG: fluoride efflux transporter CrcB [Victivallales bacterium]|nr:fluoride efflux transporter CrcB [Victivallales bacterium]